MAELAAFQIGQSVELQDGRLATVRFVGSTHFAVGDWVGVELEAATGKNDGAVQGKRYFDCKPGYGMFVRPAVAEILDQPTPKANGKLPAKADGPATKPRPPSGVAAGLKRQSVLETGVSKRQSVNAGSPTPKAKLAAGSRMSTLLRKPSSYSGSTTSSGSSTPSLAATSTVGKPSVAAVKSQPNTLNRAAKGSRNAPSNASRTSRQSVSMATTGGKRVTSTAPAPLGKNPAPGRLGLRPRATTTASSTSGSSQASEKNAQVTTAKASEENLLSPPASSGTDDVSKPSISPVLSRSSAASGKASSQKAVPSRGIASASITHKAPSSTASAAANREVEDLKAKLRFMEKKRMEDREKLKALENVQSERDKFEGIIQKLQTKYQPQQQEIVQLKKQLKEHETKLDESETQRAEYENMAEGATVDREIAEETAEMMKREVKHLEEKVEGLELDLEFLRGEKEELEKGLTPEEKSSKGWFGMVRENEKLRHLLVTLRDVTRDEEHRLQAQVEELQKDVEQLDHGKKHHEATKEKLAQSEATVEQLKEQLDSALGANEMIEELTEKNLAMKEEIDRMRGQIDEFEVLRELSWELETQAADKEKYLQKEIDHRESLLEHQYRKEAQQESRIDDLEYMVSRFKEHVGNLRNDLDDLRASQQITEIEATDLTIRSRAMMDINMKLQLSAAKMNVKTVDLELRKMEAQESLEHLAIVQLFLPEAYSTERDSVLAFLRFGRVGFKADLLHRFVKERVAIEVVPSNEENMFVACGVLDKLTWISAMSGRFVGFVSSCSVQEFAKCEGALYDLEPVERTLNGWIEGLKRDELNEKQCSAELQRTISVMSHLAEVHISQSVQNYADDIHMQAILTQNHLDNAATALSHIKALFGKALPTADEDEEAETLLQKTDAIIQHTRSAKVVTSKTVRALEELKARSLTMKLDTFTAFEQCEEGAKQLSQFTQQLGEDLSTLSHEEGREQPITYHEIQSTISQTSSTFFTTSEKDPLSTFSTKLRTLTTHLADLATLTSDLTQTIEFERPPTPWSIRAKEVKSTLTISAETEDKLRRLQDSLHERATQLAIRDKTLDESSVKIELLESRMRDANRKNDKIAELERSIEIARKREKDLANAIAVQVRELQTVEAERESWKRAANDKKATTIGTAGETAAPTADYTAAETAAVTASSQQLHALHSEISSLQAAVRYLRDDNRRARLLETNRFRAWLDEPLTHSSPSSFYPSNTPYPPTSVTPNHNAQVLKQRKKKKEANEVLHELLAMAKGAKVVDLREGQPGDMLKWRPRDGTTEWRVWKMAEEWEGWEGRWRGVLNTC